MRRQKLGDRMIVVIGALVVAAVAALVGFAYLVASRGDQNSSARELAERLPNAEYKEIPGTHMSSVTKPELGEAIASFLAA